MKKEKNIKVEEKPSKKVEEKPKKGRKTAVIALGISLAVAVAAVATFVPLYGVAQSQLNSRTNELENIYQRNFYELVDNVNNIELKMSKSVASMTDGYSGSVLAEISQNCDRAQINISELPVTMGGIEESVGFINQLGGYSAIMARKAGDGFSTEEREKFGELHESLVVMKTSLNEIQKDIQQGYRIVDNRHRIKNKDWNNRFTDKIRAIKPGNADYPEMTYDGPFSDSQITPEVRGLRGAEVSKEQAEENLVKAFGNLKNVQYQNETGGRFQTFNFTATTSHNHKIYAEVTKQGGYVLTVSSQNDGTGSRKNISIENAVSVAKEFAGRNTIKNVESIWQDVIDGDAFINLAPSENGVALYPDMIKVKVDLSTGTVIGYEASGYYSNHRTRNVPDTTVSVEEAQSKLNSKFNVMESRLVLIPLNYNQEVLAYEFICEYADSTYHIYVDAGTGDHCNVLRVIKTDSGNKLM